MSHGNPAAFPEAARAALADAHLSQVLKRATGGLAGMRRRTVEAMPEFEALRDAAQAIKDHTLAHLDLYLEAFEARVTARGGQVHWCRDAAEARDTILALCRAAGARTVTKSKSMATEEIGLNDHLASHGVAAVETDLGEYIIQLRGEAPSHIVAPALHLSKEEVAETFRTAHPALPPDRALTDIPALVGEARAVLRERYLATDVAVTGANVLVAETGSAVIVTNEGNADLLQANPKLHILLAPIDKIVPTVEDANAVLRVLARSATGQDAATYTTWIQGPRGADEAEGAGEYHVVLLDNGRSRLLGTEFQPMLRCVRCGACLNRCPVFAAVGGHAYGTVYPGPMGSVIEPALLGIEKAAHLPFASTLCGACETVCPMRIPLTRLLRRWREEAFRRRLPPSRPVRWGLAAWAFAVRRPALYHALTALTARLFAAAGGKDRRIGRSCLDPAWTRLRDLPAPEGKTFLEQWTRRGRS
jgi:L-lactate dehydrogenase complex protein LldF